MMQPPSPQPPSADAPPATAAMMEPARRKRKRPTPVAPAKRSGSGSETEDDERVGASRRRSSGESDGHGFQTMREPATDNATTTTTTTTTTRGPFRGKCLYQSRKCENERALKRNGKPHNLCDEHRNKQNQHQRKFDAKKYTRKKRSGSDDGHDDDHEEQLTAPPLSTPTTAKPTVKKEDKGGPSAKKPSGASKPKRGKISPASAVTAAVAAMPPLSTTSPTVAETPPFPAVYESNYYRPALLPTHQDTRPLEIRRPPALNVNRSSPPSAGYGLPPVGAIRSPPGAFGDDTNTRPPPQYANRDVLPTTSILVPPPATPSGPTRQAFPSPYGATPVYPFLRPPPPAPRSRSFDLGVTRISPMGGATAQPPFDRTGPFHDHQRGVTTQAQGPSAMASPLGRTDKLPSLQQLPLGQLTRSRSQSHHSPYTQAYTMAPQASYTRQSPPQQPQQPIINTFALPRPPPLNGPLLPSLAPLHQQVSHRSPPSSIPHRQASGTDVLSEDHQGYHQPHQHPY